MQVTICDRCEQQIHEGELCKLGSNIPLTKSIQRMIQDKKVPSPFMEFNDINMDLCKRCYSVCKNFILSDSDEA